MRALAILDSLRSSGTGEAVLEEAARRYERCHPGDSFADLVRRSAFSKEDRRLMEDWLAAVAAERAGNAHSAPASSARQSE